MEITDKIYEYITRIVPNEDLRQDIFVKLLATEQPTFTDDKEQRNWLSTTVSNAKVDAGRQEARRAELMEENDDFIRDIYGYNGEADDPMEVLLAEELEDNIIQDLTQLERDIYEMVIVSNLCTHKEAAEVLHITDLALRQHIYRIRRKFNGKANRSEAKNEAVHS